jgi:glycosyltransferase involved in cell wall biosynthesis
MANTSPDSVERIHSPGTRRETHVAWLFPSLARGYYWQPIFKEFAARCTNTAVFTSIWPGFAPGYENAFEVHTLPGLGYVDLKKKLPDSRRGFIWAPLSILKKLAAFRPDVVFSSGFSTWTLCALWFKLRRRTRVIIYWEGCSAQSVGSSRVKTMLRRWVGRLADAGVSNSTEGTDYLRNVIRMPQEKLLGHPCQVPDMSLLGADSGEASLPNIKRPVFLYVGSISPRKGWRYLLDATRLLVSQGMREFSVLFVGAGEQEEELRTAISEQGLEDIVHQVGGVPYHSLGYYYRSADVFVTPTRADTWGVAVLEAMAFGKAVLCSKYAGSRQMITLGENGFVFDPYDAKQLADYMARFIQDQSLASRLGARSLETMAPYTPARSAEVLADFALQIARRQRQSSGSEMNRPARSDRAHGKVATNLLRVSDK